ncbi:medium-chain fatty-acid--CoA ligase [Lacrimispora sp. 210928-DFI.3.58]|uniref:medium-chain fatty-acid--CoA ligase n=1 Tax=Lacrimispora sp. 210928-DFI.3.58 TaxID=2883214 RepID=UPI001D089516|nr:medium-chain fatty-acid--CoA ligase [Lacrimispora sp. 210928-DFI.3.58]MCB7317985.1 medium-chain fatty-acid--CoA ligase [Lacrimispora sp. 210928-DFI.3.58]
MFDEIKINPLQRQKYLEAGYWGNRTLLDCWEDTVKRCPDREYVVDDRGFRYTYRQMDEAASRVAAYLQAIGVRPKDVVSFQLPIWSEFALLTIACLKAGAVVHPIAMCYEEKELIRSMRITESKAYFGPTFFHKTDYESRILAVMDQIPSLKGVVLLDSARERTSSLVSLREILAQYQPLKKEECVHELTGQDIAAILCTSGTTGGTKGVLLSHDNIRYSEEAFYKELKLTQEDIMFMPAPLNHATGFHHGVIATMMIGAKLVLQQKYYCREAIELMNKEKCTYSMGATPFIYDILRELENNGGDLPFLKFYLCGGAPVPGYLIRKAWKFRILLCEVYGSTESVPHVFVRPEEVLAFNGTSSGRPLGAIEVKVVDDDGREVPKGMPGEEISRGPNVFVGYLKDRAVTDGVLDDEGWFHSGDLCVMDEDGNIHIIGRKKDMIVRGGENLNSNEINDHLEGCPGMGDHTIIGMPDERMGERICAFAVPLTGHEDLSLEEVKAYLREKQVPKRFWPERLELIGRIPHTGSGKVKKYLLREELQRRMDGEKQ